MNLTSLETIKLPQYNTEMDREKQISLISNHSPLPLMKMLKHHFSATIPTCFFQATLMFTWTTEFKWSAWTAYCTTMQLLHKLYQIIGYHGIPVSQIYIIWNWISLKFVLGGRVTWGASRSLFWRSGLGWRGYIMGSAMQEDLGRIKQGSSESKRRYTCSCTYIICERHEMHVNSIVSRGRGKNVPGPGQNCIDWMQIRWNEATNIKDHKSPFARKQCLKSFIFVQSLLVAAVSLLVHTL